MSFDSVYSTAVVKNTSGCADTSYAYPNRSGVLFSVATGLPHGNSPHVYGATKLAREKLAIDFASAPSGTMIYTNVSSSSAGAGPTTLQTGRISNITAGSSVCGIPKPYLAYVPTSPIIGASGYKIGRPFRSIPTPVKPQVPGMRNLVQPAMVNRIARPMVPAALAFMAKRSFGPAAILAVPEAIKLAADLLARDFDPSPGMVTPTSPAGEYMLMLASESESLAPSAPPNPTRPSPINIMFVDNSNIIDASVEIFNFDFDEKDPAELTELSQDWLKSLAGAIGGIISMLGGEILDSLVDGVVDLAAGIMATSTRAAGKAIAEVLGRVLSDLIDAGLKKGEDGFDYADDPVGLDYDALTLAISTGVSEALATMPAPPPSEVVFSESVTDLLNGFFKVTGSEASLADVLTFPFVLPDPSDPAPF